MVMDKVRVGVIGAGQRGKGVTCDLLTTFDTVKVTAICDNFEDRAEKLAEYVTEKTGVVPFVTKDHHELLAREDIDAVMIFTPWECHIPMAIDAMNAGKAVGVEVCGATSVQECWDLVRTWEKTRVPFMFLENCNYGRPELAVMNMVRQGLFGELVHCDGAYGHDLRDEISEGVERHHYRLRHYKQRNCENYPTHALGPIAKILDINDGNRFVSLVSMSSKAAGLQHYLKDHTCAGCDENTNWTQGDVFTTLIKCANGETIKLTLDTTLPRYYTRDFTIRGVKGFYEEKTNSVYLDGMDHNNWSEHWNNLEEYYKDYEHPIWKKFLAGGVVGGHGGMDGLVYGAFIECLRNGWDMPIDVYDAAAWMAITPLSEESVRLGSAAVAIPDFTDGKWLQREERNCGEYGL